jgi:hypothetical protein
MHSKGRMAYCNRSRTDVDWCRRFKVYALWLILVAVPPLAYAEPARVPSAESGNYDKFCTDKWTRRGELDVRMHDFCMTQQIEGKSWCTS